MQVWSFAAVYGLVFGALGLRLGVNMAAAPKPSLPTPHTKLCTLNAQSFGTCESPARTASSCNAILNCVGPSDH